MSISLEQLFSIACRLHTYLGPPKLSVIKLLCENSEPQTCQLSHIFRGFQVSCPKHVFTHALGNFKHFTHFLKKEEEFLFDIAFYQFPCPFSIWKSFLLFILTRLSHVKAHNVKQTYKIRMTFTKYLRLSRLNPDFSAFYVFSIHNVIGFSWQLYLKNIWLSGYMYICIYIQEIRTRNHCVYVLHTDKKINKKSTKFVGQIFVFF